MKRTLKPTWENKAEVQIGILATRIFKFLGLFESGNQESSTDSETGWPHNS